MAHNDSIHYRAEKDKYIHVGTSGWNYKHWRGPFYPENVTQDKWLAYYSERFDSVEINNSFYQLPDKKTIKKWRDTVSNNFIFAFKASRYITHMKKLKDPEDPLRKLLDVTDALGSQLGPILFQLPPHWNCNIKRLEQFLKALPNGRIYAVEFRDPSWWHDDVYDLLRQYNAAFCIFDLRNTLSPKEITGDFVYVRLHGPSRRSYQGSYSPENIAGWAGAFAAWRRKDHEIYCFFDNDQNGYAPQNARRLVTMV